MLEGVEKENRFLCSGEGRIEEEAEMGEGRRRGSTSFVKQSVLISARVR